MNWMHTKITCLISAGGEFEFIFEVSINLFLLNWELTDLAAVIGFFLFLSKSLSGPKIYDKKKLDRDPNEKKRWIELTTNNCLQRNGCIVWDANVAEQRDTIDNTNEISKK